MAAAAVVAAAAPVLIVVPIGNAVLTLTDFISSENFDHCFSRRHVLT